MRYLRLVIAALLLALAPSPAHARPSLVVSSNETAALGAHAGARVKGRQANWAPNLVGWWISNAGVTSSSGSVSTWADQSTNGNNGTNSGSVRPTLTASDSGYGGRPVIVFAHASSQQLNLVSDFPAQPFTVYVVGESTSGAFQQNFFGDQTNNISLFISPAGTPWSIFGGTAVKSSANTTQGSKQLFIAIFNGASSALYINSTATNLISGNPGTTSPAGSMAIGAKGATGQLYLNGKIAEMVLRTGVDSAIILSDTARLLAAEYNASWQ